MPVSRSLQIQSLPRTPPEPTVEQRGFVGEMLFQTDHLLRNRESVFNDIVHERQLARFCAVSAAMTCLYGGAYGATMGLHAGIAQMLVSAIKVPLLLAISLFAVSPPLYAFNTLLGSRIAMTQLAAVLCGTMASTAILLLALAPFSIFVSYSGLSYSVLKLAHVVLFFVAGYCGAFFLYEGIQTVAARTGREQNLPILQVWLLTYAFAGAQLAWILRPFVGDPTGAPGVVRGLGGSFFTGLLDALMTAFR